MTPRSKRFARIVLAGAIAAALPAMAMARQVDYENVRYGTSASFPSEAFPNPLPTPTSNDGMGWAADNGANIFIYARANAGDETPRSVIEGRADEDDVTYSKFGDRWGVVSGYRDGQIFYERYIFRGDLIHSVSMRYPESARQTYDPLVKTVTESLRGPSAPLEGESASAN